MQINTISLVSWVNFLLNIAIQGSIIFIPLLGAQLGASNFEVGLIGAAYGGAYLLSSLYPGDAKKQPGKQGTLILLLRLYVVLFSFLVLHLSRIPEEKTGTIRKQPRSIVRLPKRAGQSCSARLRPARRQSSPVSRRS